MENEEECDERNVNKITTDTLFQFPVTINAQKIDANMKQERQFPSDIRAEMIRKIIQERDNNIYGMPKDF